MSLVEVLWALGDRSFVFMALEPQQHHDPLHAAIKVSSESRYNLHIEMDELYIPPRLTWTFWCLTRSSQKRRSPSGTVASNKIVLRGN